MITKEQKVRLAVFTVASLALLAVLLGILIIPSFRDKGLVYSINFKRTSVTGLEAGAAVKYRGVGVGTVERVHFNPNDLDSILVSVRIGREFPVKRDMTATLTYAGITGLKFVELSGGSQASERLPVGGEIPMGRGLGEKAEDIVSNIDAAMRSINSLLGEENQKQIAQFLASTEQSAAVVSRVLKSKEQNLVRAVDNIEKAAMEFGAVTENLRQVSADLGRLTGQLDARAGTALDNINKRFSDEEMGRVLQNLENFIETTSLSIKRVESLVIAQQEDLRRSVENLGAAMDNLSKFSRELIEDPTLFLRGRRGKK